MNEIIIKVTKCTLILYEKELFQLLATRPDLFEKAISRGKGYRRSERVNTYFDMNNPWNGEVI